MTTIAETVLLQASPGTAGYRQALRICRERCDDFEPYEAGYSAGERFNFRDRSYITHDGRGFVAHFDGTGNAALDDLVSAGIITPEEAVACIERLRAESGD